MRPARLTAFAALALAFAACTDDPALDDTDAHVVAPRPDAGAPDADTTDAVPQPDAEVIIVPDADTTDAIPPADAGNGCATWQVDRDQDVPAGTLSTAAISQGGLVLSSAGDGQGVCSSDVSPCDAIKVYQQPLHGDFEITAEVDSVDGAGAFAGLSLFLAYPGNFDDYTAVSIFGGGSSAANLSVERRSFGSNAQQAAFAPSTHATLHAKRVGSMITISGEAGGAVLDMNNIFMSGDLVVGLGLDEGFVSTPVSAHVTSFTVTGGGGSVGSDSFACDATLTP